MSWSEQEIIEGARDALAMYNLLREGGELRPSQVRLRLRPDEFAVVERPVDYARFYGFDAEWTHITSPFSLNPLRHLGHAVANNRRKERALRESAARWRDWHRNLVTVTNMRLLLYGDSWHSFWYEEFYELEPKFDHPHRGQYGFSATFADAPQLGLFGPYVLTVLLLIEYFTSRFQLLVEHSSFQQWLAVMTGESPAPGPPA